VSGSVHGQPDAEAASAPVADRVRVVTFNVLARQHASGHQRHQVVRRALAELRPDVVALQEVTRGAGTDQAADQALEPFGPDFEVVDHPAPSPDGVGACLASRWPIGEVLTVELAAAPGAVGLSWAAAVAVEVLAPAPLGPLLVVHHKPNWQLDREHVREQQALITARWVEGLVAERPDRPVVLLGDLDARPDAASIRFWTGRQSLDGTSVRYEDAWEVVHPGEPGHTFTPRNPLVRGGEMPLERGRRIDYVMVRSGSHGPLLDVADCRLVFDQPVEGVWASDHFGVLADLTLPDHPPGSWA
jgi:endonuclease/exonuclease/phosphatase family metal-dependent hydrolase